MDDPSPLITFLVGFSGRESVTPGPLAGWDRWITARFADLASFLGKAPVVVQAAMLVALASSVAVLLARAVRRGRRLERATGPGRGAPTFAIDPVCGMRVDPGRPGAAVDWAGTGHLFCARACADSFKDDPSRFVGIPRVDRVGQPIP